jgi:hypothetical protein
MTGSVTIRAGSLGVNFGTVINVNLKPFSIFILFPRSFNLHFAVPLLFYIIISDACVVFILIQIRTTVPSLQIIISCKCCPRETFADYIFAIRCLIMPLQLIRYIAGSGCASSRILA